jgi:hypothetical protein
VIVREFGAVGLGHLLLAVADQEIVALPNGCICCAVRKGLAETLYCLLRRRVRDGDVWLAEPPPAPRPPAAVAVVPSVVDHTAARAAADAFAWHMLPASGRLEHLAGEPLQQTAARWAHLPEIEPPSGHAVASVATSEIEYERNCAAPVLTGDEGLTENKQKP